MLSSYYTTPERLEQLYECLSGNYLDDFTKWFSEKGYVSEYGKKMLNAVYNWSVHLKLSGVENISELSEDTAKDFLRKYLTLREENGISKHHLSSERVGVSNFIAFLVETEAIEKSIPEKTIETPLLAELRNFEEYLDKIFGIQSYTRRRYCKKATLFMNWMSEKYEELSFSSLSPTDIIEYQTMLNNQNVLRKTKQSWASMLRVFLRYLYWKRLSPTDLSPIVYSMRNWTLADVPRYMSYEDMQILTEAPNRYATVAKRDTAMLLLMVRLGLRSMEVIKLKIQDIDFENGTITLQKTKSGKERILPMSTEIAEAIIEYLKVRHKNSTAETLFLMTKAPYGALGTSASVLMMVNKYLKATGVNHPTCGTHQLRHGFATHLINQNVSIKDIADLMGHASIDTTAVYAKVNISGLKQVALPFPMTGGASL